MGYILDGIKKFLYSGSTHNVEIDADENLVANQIKAKANFKDVVVITGDTTLNTETNEVIGVNTTAGDVTITLPLASSIPDDGFIRKFTIQKASGDNNIVNITTTSPDTFPLGYNKITIGYQEEVIDIGGSHNSWGKTSTIKVATLTHRTSIWDKANFEAWTAIPFEHTDVQDNTEIFEWDIANPTRITSKIKTRANIAFKLDVNSTGGGTWNLGGKIVKNGITDEDFTQIITGNYGGEDGFLVIPTVPIDLEIGDYIEIQINQDNLTGNIYSAWMVIDSLI